MKILQFFIHRASEIIIIACLFLLNYQYQFIDLNSIVLDIQTRLGIQSFDIPYIELNIGLLTELFPKLLVFYYSGTILVLLILTFFFFIIFIWFLTKPVDTKYIKNLQEFKAMRRKKSTYSRALLAAILVILSTDLFWLVSFAGVSLIASLIAYYVAVYAGDTELKAKVEADKTKQQ